jgi:putative FmdB family regulatory protein
VPTYEYACTACDERLEAVQKFSDDPLTKCSACGGRLRKLFSPVGIVFKGSGFYRTDSRNGAGSKAAKVDGAASEKPATDKPASEKAASDKPASGDAAKPSGEGKPAKKPESAGAAGSAPKPAKVA